MVDASPLAYLALALVVPGSILAFATLKPTRAVLAIVFASLLFAPEVLAFDAPLIPPLHKHSLSALCVLVGVLVTARQKIIAARPGRGFDLLLIAFLLASAGTVLTNKDPIDLGKVHLLAHTNSDVVSELIRSVCGPVVLFFVGRTLFRTSEDARDLLRALVIGTIVYVPLILLELRLSPVLHLWLYGYGQNAMDQLVRGHGYRAVVFMTHSLALALFVAAGVMAAWTLVKARGGLFGRTPRGIAWCLTAFHPLVKCMAAIVYGLVAVPLIALCKPRTQLRAACIIACCVVLYPWLRISDNFPRRQMVDLAARVSQDRAASLEFRFRNEDLLVERALERPWFGWGRYGRSHIFDPWGRELSIADGAWIIFLGNGGVALLVLHFGLLLLPVFRARRQLERLGPSEQQLLAGLSLIVVFYASDQLPNGAFNNLPMFLSGSVLGLAQGMTTARVSGREQLVARLRSLLRASLAQPSLEGPRRRVA